MTHRTPIQNAQDILNIALRHLESYQRADNKKQDEDPSTTIETILRKSNKSNYTKPNAYHSIALESIVIKILESIIIDRICYFYTSIPQGSLSPILYILYNSDLLEIPKGGKQLELDFVDDILYEVQNKMARENASELEELIRVELKMINAAILRQDDHFSSSRQDHDWTTGCGCEGRALRM